MLYRFKFNPLFKDTVNPKKDAISPFPTVREWRWRKFFILIHYRLEHSGLRSEESLPAQKIGRFFGKQAVAFVVGVNLVGTQLPSPEDFRPRAA